MKFHESGGGGGVGGACSRGRGVRFCFFSYVTSIKLRLCVYHVWRAPICGRRKLGSELVGAWFCVNASQAVDIPVVLSPVCMTAVAEP